MAEKDPPTVAKAYQRKQHDGRLSGSFQTASSAKKDGKNASSGPRALATEFGRVLPNDAMRALLHTRFVQPALRSFSLIRQNILWETLERLEKASASGHYYKLALTNAERWAAAVRSNVSQPTTLEPCTVEVLPGDWGDVTLQMSKKYGVMFACLNMANAYTPGGGYVEGHIAQEENMFRRTDCHYSLNRRDLRKKDKDYVYKPQQSKVLNAEMGNVYLDTKPRICIRGSEDVQLESLGYPWLPDEDIFQFYELRAAAVDLRTSGSYDSLRPYDHKEMTRRVEAQLDTLIKNNVRHAVLSAFGCGAFRNPATHVASAYLAAITARAKQFDVIVFAIFHAGYGPDNWLPFATAFEGWGGAPTAADKSPERKANEKGDGKKKLGLPMSRLQHEFVPAETPLFKELSSWCVHLTSRRLNFARALQKIPVTEAAQSDKVATFLETSLEKLTRAAAQEFPFVIGLETGENIRAAIAVKVTPPATRRDTCSTMLVYGISLDTDLQGAGLAKTLFMVADIIATSFSVQHGWRGMKVELPNGHCHYKRGAVTLYHSLGATVLYNTHRLNTDQFFKKMDQMLAQEEKVSEGIKGAKQQLHCNQESLQVNFPDR